MADLNALTLTGRLTKDVQQVAFGDGKFLCKGSVAFGGTQGKNNTAFLDFVAFGRVAEALVGKLKGAPVFLAGCLQGSCFTSKDGKEVRKTELLVEMVGTLTSNERSEKVPQTQAQPVPQGAGWREDPDIPF